MTKTNTLPRVLAGPILRRVTPKSVTVWLAASEPLAVTLRIYREDGEQVGSSVPPDSPRQCSHAEVEPRLHNAILGQRLHIYLLEAHPDRHGDHFPLDTLLSYSLLEKSTSEEEQPLPEMADVCLDGATRPSFYIPSQLGIFAYGSCRKPHGLSFDDQITPQHKDSLALLAEHLQENAQNLANRPSHLFLVGDQIYADEVPEIVMDYLQKLAVELMLNDIRLPGEPANQYALSTIKPQERDALKRHCGLTSDCKDMHLLGFGEFAAMYLMVFGNRIQFSIPEGAEDRINDADQKERERKRGNLQNLRQFLACQDKVRKTLANISTYMMFDDHDVTDDWNLNRTWYNQVHSSPAGSRVISNALAAFWAFQGWGNQPAHFDNAFIRALENHLLVPDNAEYAERFDFALRRTHPWSFTLPTYPPVMVLDCRTQRDFGTFSAPPKLLDHYALDALHEAWLQLPQTYAREYNIAAPTNLRDTTPIFVTGTPVFGFSVIEFAQKASYWLGFLFGRMKGFGSPSRLDVESWIANSRGFSAFLNTILYRLGHTKATFIAGDVHYSFANRATYTSTHAPGQVDTLQCLQLTSSALRNTPESGRHLEAFLANDIHKTRHGHSKPESLAWWNRLIGWRFLQQDIWEIKVEGIPGKSVNPRPAPKLDKSWERALAFCLHHLWRLLEKRDGKARDEPHTYWITCRPNVGLVYLENGEVIRQVLLSGDERQNTLTYTVKTTTN